SAPVRTESVAPVTSFGELVREIVTPDSPGSPASRTPLPFRSLNFTPAIEPVIRRLPKRLPDEVRCAKLTFAEIVPGAAGAVCVNPGGGVSVSVKAPNGTLANVKLPWASVTTERVAFAASLTEAVRVIVTPARPGSPASRTPVPFKSRNFVPVIDPVNTPRKLPKVLSIELPPEASVTAIEFSAGSVSEKPWRWVSDRR